MTIYVSECRWSNSFRLHAVRFLDSARRGRDVCCSCNLQTALGRNHVQYANKNNHLYVVFLFYKVVYDFVLWTLVFKLDIYRLTYDPMVYKKYDKNKK